MLFYSHGLVSQPFRQGISSIQSSVLENPRSFVVVDFRMLWELKFVENMEHILVIARIFIIQVKW